MTVRNIIEIGHRVLKLKNKPVVDFHSPLLKKLINDLKDTMTKVDLIGIAAPQIGENYQVFLTQPRKTNARKLEKGDVLRVYINPKITFKSKETNLIYEGCGCVPHSSIFGPVVRPREIEVEAYDIAGQKFRLRCDGILARVIQQPHFYCDESMYRVAVWDAEKQSSIWRQPVSCPAQQRYRVYHVLKYMLQNNRIKRVRWTKLLEIPLSGP